MGRSTGQKFGVFRIEYLFVDMTRRKGRRRGYANMTNLHLLHTCASLYHFHGPDLREASRWYLNISRRISSGSVWAVAYGSASRQSACYAKIAGPGFYTPRPFSWRDTREHWALRPLWHTMQRIIVFIFTEKTRGRWFWLKLPSKVLSSVEDIT